MSASQVAPRGYEAGSDVRDGAVLVAFCKSRGGNTPGSGDSRGRTAETSDRTLCMSPLLGRHFGNPIAIPYEPETIEASPCLVGGPTPTVMK